MNKLIPILGCLAILTQQEASATQTIQPRLYGWGAINGKSFGYADGLLPIIQTANNLSFIDLIAKGGDSQGYLLSMGGGNRRIFNDSHIVGGYLFFDRNKVNSGTYSWSAHPGVELITNLWDFHLNGYIPLKDNKLIQKNEHLTVLSNHQEYLGEFNKYNQFAKGVDIIAGRKVPFFKKSRVYGSGYYYNYKNANSITGVEIGIQTPLTKNISLLIRDSYDNYSHNEFSIGFSISLGDKLEMDKNEIHDRLLDPIQHYSGTLNTGTGNPVKIYHELLKKTLVRDNIWFFEPLSKTTFNASKGVNNCTFENPCSGPSFTQTNLNTINTLASNSNLYINSGSINFVGQYIDVPNGTNIFGRMNNFANMASGSNRPTFNGTFLVNGNNMLDSFKIVASNVTIPGFGSPQAWGLVSPSSATDEISISNLDVSASSIDNSAIAAEFQGGTLVINNSSFTSISSSPNDNFSIALALRSPVNSTTINNSKFLATNSGSEGLAQGVTGGGSNNITIDNSTIEVININGTTSATDNSTIGIQLTDNAKLTLTNSQLTTNQQGGTRDSSGIKSVNTSSAVINNSVFNIMSNQLANSASATNILAGTGGVIFNNSTITVINPGSVAQLDQRETSTLNNTTSSCNGGSC